MIKFAVSCGLVTFTEEFLDGKLHFLCCDIKNPEHLINFHGDIQDAGKMKQNCCPSTKRYTGIFIHNSKFA